MKDLAEKVYLEHNTHMKKYSMPELHSHEHLELYYLTEGNRQYFINDTLYFVNSGDVIIIPPDILHRTIGNEEGFFSRILLYFPETILEDEISEAYLKGTHDYFYKIPQKRKFFFESIINKIEYEINKKDEFSDYLISGYINELMIFLTRLKNSEYNDTFVHETDETISTATKFIKNNFYKDLSLDDVAKSVNMSKTYFSKYFKHRTGFGFSDYLMKVRISEATKLLTETDLSITEIAYKCGFNGSSYFASAFKKFKGVTPLKYKNYGN